MDTENLDIPGEDFEIACFECEEGYIHLDFETVAVRLTKERFLEFTALLDQVRSLIVNDGINREESLGLN